MPTPLTIGSWISIFNPTTTGFLLETELESKNPPDAQQIQHIPVTIARASDAIWEIEEPIEVGRPNEPLTNHAKIRLKNVITGRRLHSHDRKSTLFPDKQEVTVFSVAGGSNHGDNWEVILDADGQWLSDQPFRLKHGNQGNFLISATNLLHNSLTEGAQGVVCGTAGDEGAVWKSNNKKRPPVTVTALKEMMVSGFRSFRDEQRLAFGVPRTDQAGSGLTILVGANNGGKSAVLEALDLILRGKNASLPKDVRHAHTSMKAQLSVIVGSQKSSLASGVQNPGTLLFAGSAIPPDKQPLHIPTIRELPKTGNTVSKTWDQFVSERHAAYSRDSEVDRLATRVARWKEPSSRFTLMLNQIIGGDFKMDYQLDGAELSVFVNTVEHPPVGLGTGIKSLCHIVDALDDAPPGSVILIDEPELSLHPSFQHRLLDILAVEAQRLQIIYTTHSPFMLEWKWLFAGASLARVYRRKNGFSSIAMLAPSTLDVIKKLSENKNNPHVLGTNASELFFLHDRVILVEGQEDVIFYKMMAAKLEIDLRGQFYGWGVGGAGNMATISQLLKDLEFEKVYGLLDANMQDERDELEKKFPGYSFICIPAEDVRDKLERCKMISGIPTRLPAIQGLCRTDGVIHENRIEDVKALFNKINGYFSDAPASQAK